MLSNANVMTRKFLALAILLQCFLVFHPLRSEVVYVTKVNVCFALIVFVASMEQPSSKFRFTRG